MRLLNTIKVAFRAAFVTSGFLPALAAAGLFPLCAAAEPSAPYEDFIRETNVCSRGGLTIHRLNVGPLAANCYLVADRQKRAIVIDPGACPDTLRRYIADQSLSVAAYVLTHSHLDHISALDELAAAIPAEIALHPEENDWAFCAKNEWLPAYPRTREVAIARPLRHQQRFTDGGLAYTVIHTPGHSPGSVCIWFPTEKIVFSGDTLFAGTVGRTDLHRSNQTSLIRSLGVFLLMPANTEVFAGHGAPTTVAAELEGNPFLQDTPPQRGKKAGHE
ncbi:MAG TPA: MBL fold metallo-hydrolase [Kiritimatiellia bacterium]|nr:MBL fold metallo-hydrolase [Kiritimatiellia bacterium]HPS06301.1 MBL fold metallo-hydrolase [Kiritimatiellia bacterium]